MAAISALQAYGSDESDNGSESDEVCEDATAHLKPLNTGNNVLKLQSRLQLNAAPAVENKVRFIT